MEDQLKVVFLDIDGVLQPYESEYRFYDDKDLVSKLSQRYGIDYSIYNFSDVAAAYYDWDEQAISRLKYILNSTGSKIITSSNWRSKQFPNKMRDLLRIQGLDKYYFKDNELIKEDSSLAKRRFLEIKRSLEIYHIVNYVVLDDEKELHNYFPDNSVITHNLLGINDMNKCIRILKK